MDEINQQEVARCLFRESNDALLLIQPDQELVLDVNPAALRLTGYRRKGLLGVSLSSVLTGDGSHRMQQLRQAFQKTGFFHSAEGYLMRRIDGSTIVVNVSISRIHTRPEPMGLVMVRDISQRVRQEEHLRQLQSQLAHAARLVALGELATTLAHEINQPLGTIVNQAQASLQEIQRNSTDTGRIQQTFADIAQEALVAGEIVRRVRKFVAKNTVRESNVDLNCLVTEVYQLIRAEATSNGVTVMLALAEDLLPVACDAVQIQQVVINLVRNALQATASLERDDGRVLVKTINMDGSVRVTVTDNGPGLSAHMIQKAFEPYFTSKPDGLGLGLNISQSIVARHGGKLWAAPNQDRGLAVQFEIPNQGNS